MGKEPQERELELELELELASESESAWVLQAQAWALVGPVRERAAELSWLWKRSHSRAEF